MYFTAPTQEKIPYDVGYADNRFRTNHRRLVQRDIAMEAWLMRRTTQDTEFGPEAGTEYIPVNILAFVPCGPDNREIKAVAVQQDGKLFVEDYSMFRMIQASRPPVQRETVFKADPLTPEEIARREKILFDREVARNPQEVEEERIRILKALKSARRYGDTKAEKEMEEAWARFKEIHPDASDVVQW